MVVGSDVIVVFACAVLIYTGVFFFPIYSTIITSIKIHFNIY